MTVIHTPEASEAAAAASSAPVVSRPETEGQPIEVLFPEAKQRERRRRLTVVLLVLAAAGTAIGVTDSSGHPPPPRSGTTKHQGSASSASLAQARSPKPNVPGTPRYDGPAFGQLSVTSAGVLYYVDSQRGQIDRMTSSGPRIVLSSLSGSTRSSDAIRDLTGLSVAKNSLWFAANGGLYESNLDGGHLQRMENAPGVIELNALSNGTLYYSEAGTSTGEVFERTPSGVTRRVAGGGTHGSAVQLVGAHPATSLSLYPGWIAGVDDSDFYFVSENALYRVRDRISTQLPDPEYGLNYFNGELAVAPNASVFGICSWSVCRIDGAKSTVVFPLPAKGVDGIFANPDGLAVAPNGNFYVSFDSGGSPEKSGIYEMSSTGKFLHVLVSRNG
jgi:hypothetical protein